MAIEITVRMKAIVRKLPQIVIPQRIGNKNILNRRLRNMLFEIKQVLSQSKTFLLYGWNHCQLFFIVDEDNAFRFLLQGKCIFVVNQFKTYY